jgi:hypothetical protein
LAAVVSGTPPFTYQWFIDGTVVTNDPMYFYSSSTTGTHPYRVSVTDATGCTTTSSTLQIAVVTPSFTTNLPASKTVATGGTVTFTIAATGSNLSYEWWRSGYGSYAITGATLPTYTITNADPLTHVGDNPDYRCKVTDGCGNTVWSTTCRLIVNP